MAEPTSHIIVKLQCTEAAEQEVMDEIKLEAAEFYVPLQRSA